MALHNTGVQLTTSTDSLVVNVRGERAAVYSTVGRSPSFQTLYVEGAVLTDRACSTDPGCWISHGDVNGLPFGNTVSNSEGLISGRIVSESVTARRGSQSVGFRHDTDWQDLSGHTIALTSVTARVTSGPSQGAIIDLAIRFSATEHESVVLGVTSDALLHVRLPSALFPGGGGHIRNGLGDSAMELIHGRRAPLFGCTGVINAMTVGLAILDHPDNISYPTTWRLLSGECGAVTVSAACFDNCSVTLLPLETITFRFRLQTHAGYVNDGWALARASEFAAEPLRV